MIAADLTTTLIPRLKEFRAHDDAIYMLPNSIALVGWIDYVLNTCYFKVNPKQRSCPLKEVESRCDRIVIQLERMVSYISLSFFIFIDTF